MPSRSWKSLARAALVVKGDDVLGGPRHVRDYKADTRIEFAWMPFWTCPRLVESHCLSLSFVLELYWAFVAESRMPAHGIIKAVNISGDRIFGLAA
jgi:hypothetical protein